jgi:hypothetical protein
MIFKFCWLFNWSILNLQCVTTTESAAAVLQTQKVEEILWYPDFLEDTQEFKEYLKMNYPKVKLTGIDLWTPSHDCGWYL